jgi:Mrp family chromosome partitioning ATPase
VLVGEASLEDAFIEPEIDASQGGRLRALPAGPPAPNPSELLASQRMKNLLEQLTGMSELVILDSTPLLTVSDSLPLVEIVSGVVAVARLNKTSKEAIRRLEQVITNAGGTLLGSVATGAAATGLYGGYGYPGSSVGGRPYAEGACQEVSRRELAPGGPTHRSASQARCHSAREDRTRGGSFHRGRAAMRGRRLALVQEKRA